MLPARQMQKSLPPSHSPVPSTNLGQVKRTRKIFSCSQCRRKKLRCDRLYPSCGRCRELGRPSSCAYSSSSFQSSNLALLSPGTRDDSLRMTHHDQDDYAELRRSVDDGASFALWSVAHSGIGIAALDLDLGPTQAYYRPASSTANSLPSESPDYRSFLDLPPSSTDADVACTYPEEEAMLFSGTGFGTSYFGASYPPSVVTTAPTFLKSLPELKIFMGDPKEKNRAFSNIRDIADSLDEKRKQIKTDLSAEPLPTPLQFLCKKPRSQVTKSCEIYWNTMETTYRVLHRPTFWVKYKAFLANPTNVAESFVAIIILVLAVVTCLSPNKPLNHHVGLSSTGREEAKVSISICEHWLSRQRRKKETIEHLQIRVLVFIAKRINLIHANHGWEESSALLTFAVTMGLHRNIDFLYNCRLGSGLAQVTSDLDREMRRRLWTTITELDLQAALERGVPSSSNSFSADCGPPSNNDDTDLGSMSGMLSAKPLDVITASSFLALSSRSFTLRSDMNQVINTPGIKLLYDEILHYHASIMEELDAMPSWVETERRSRSASIKPAFPALLLDMQLRQYLLLLHLPFAQQADINPRYRYSKTICLNTANIILEHHFRLSQSGNQVLNHLRNDVFRAALAVCHSTISWNTIQDDLYVQTLRASFAQQVEKAIVLLEARVLRVGAQHKQLFFLGAAYGMLRTSSIRKNAQLHFQDYVNRLMKLYQVIISSQAIPMGDWVGLALTNISNEPEATSPAPNRPKLDNMADDLESIDLGPELSQPGRQPEELPPVPWNLEDIWDWNDTR